MNVFVVPAYDEEANLPRLLADLESRPKLWSGGRVIVVDDGSSDATAAVAGAHPGRLPVEVISLGTNQGPGRAFDRGFRRALEVAPEDGFVVTLEADTTSDLDALGGMLDLARGGADVVLASTHARAAGSRTWAARRRVLSRAAVLRDPPHERRGRAHGLDLLPRLPRIDPAPGLRRATATTLVRERGFACKAELLFKLGPPRRAARGGARGDRLVAARGREQDARAPHDGRLHAADDAAGVRPPRRSARERRDAAARSRPRGAARGRGRRRPARAGRRLPAGAGAACR